MAKIKMRQVKIEPFFKTVYVAVGDNSRDTINAMLKALKISDEVGTCRSSIASCYVVEHEGREYMLLSFQKQMTIGTVVHEMFHVINRISFDGTGDAIGSGSDEGYAYAMEMAVDRVGKAIFELGGDVRLMGKE